MVLLRRSTSYSEDEKELKINESLAIRGDKLQKAP